ncbi:MAG: hypothetical protein QOH08_530 [Chloroflexota bacterium]|nr:hypothetical protein [Chloroflexota bacterium]
MLLARYVRNFRRPPRLLRPRTFNEHVLVKLIFDRDPKLTLFADKLAVRRYVAERLGGEEHLTTLHAALERPEDIRGLALPSRFIMKPNHLSGRVKVVRDLATVERAELERLGATWLRQNLGFDGGEWAYRNIPPRLLFEELLDFEGRPPDDYRFYCFGGEPRMISLTRDRLGPDPTNTLYDERLRLLPVRQVSPLNRHVPVEHEPPPAFDRMLEIARRLSAGTDFLRVDLYNLGGRIVFGELTNYPSSGLRKFDPPSFDLTLGSYWR